MAERNTNLSVPKSTTRGGEPRTPSPSSAPSGSLNSSATTQTLIESPTSTGATATRGAAPATSATASAPNGGQPSATFLHAGGEATGGSSSLSASTSCTSSPFASFANFPTASEAASASVGAVGEVRNRPGAIPTHVHHQRSRSLPEPNVPRRQGVKIARLDDFAVDSSPEDVPPVVGDFNAVVEEVEGDEDGAESAGACAIGGDRQPARDWVSTEGVRIVVLAREFLLQAVQSYGYTPMQLCDAGLETVDGGREQTASGDDVCIEKKIAARLNEMVKKYETRTSSLDNLVESLRGMSLNYRTFSWIARELIRRAGGLTWGTITAIFVLAQKIVLIFLEKAQSVRRILVWFGRFVFDELLQWIMEVGGGFLSLLQEPLSARGAAVGFGVIFAIAVVFYYIK